MKEEWRDVKDYEGLYMVSNLGRVKSLSYHQTGEEGILKGHPDSKGYLRAELTKDGKRKYFRIHRLVVEAFIGPIPEGMEIDHVDTCKTNNVLSNLRIVSSKDNSNNPLTLKHHLEAANRPEVIEKNRQAQLELWSNPEYKERMIQAAIIAKSRPEVKEKMSQNMFRLWSNPEYKEKQIEASHKRFSKPEEREKMSKAQKKRYENPEEREKITMAIKLSHSTTEYLMKRSIAVVQLTLEGEFVAEFYGATEASRVTGISQPHISQCCQGKRNKAGGYIWRYASEYKKEVQASQPELPSL